MSYASLGASDRTIGRLAAPTTPEGEPLEADGVWSAAARATLERAVAEANARGDGHIGTEHLLLSILQQPSSLAGLALAGAGLAPDAVRAAIERQLQQHV